MNTIPQVIVFAAILILAALIPAGIVACLAYRQNKRYFCQQKQNPPKTNTYQEKQKESILDKI